MKLTITCSFQLMDEEVVIGVMTFTLMGESSKSGITQCIFAVNIDDQTMAISYYKKGFCMQSGAHISDIDRTQMLLLDGIEIDLEGLLFELALSFYRNPNKSFDEDQELYLENDDPPKEIIRTLSEWEKAKMIETPTILH